MRFWRVGGYKVKAQSINNQNYEAVVRGGKGACAIVARRSVRERQSAEQKSICEKIYSCRMNEREPEENGQTFIEV